MPVNRETLKLMKPYQVIFYEGVYPAVALFKKGTTLTTGKAYDREAAKAGRVVMLFWGISFIPS